MPGSFRFSDFRLDEANRQLSRGGEPVELNARYLDALALLVREPGRLVTKERFLQEVWRGVPVTDEALTQCIKTLRRQLGDEAGRPRFIETVPKHGYRFIAPVTLEGDAAPAAATVPAAARSWRRLALLGAAGTAGGGVAGMFGGLCYSFVGATQAGEPGLGAASALLVLVCLTVLVGLLGGAGVAFGVAAAGLATAGLATARQALWSIAGGAAGGFLVGAFVKLVGLDAFNLLFGRTPGAITGGPEGAVLGAAVGLGYVLARRAEPSRSLGRSIAAAAVAGAAAGVLIQLAGGRLMAGSLDLLASRFPNSRIRLDQIGALFGERGFGPVSRTATAAVEGLLFSACVVAAMVLGRRKAV